MAEDRPSPIRPTDDEARAEARRLIDDARFGALAVRQPGTGAPMVTRIAVARDARGAPLTLISDLSAHTEALAADPVCSLLLGEPGDRGDPLTWPRITLQCRAARRDKTEELRGLYLQQQPKARLYIDFADFNFVAFEVTEAHLNGGFGRAYRLTPADLGL